MRISKMTMQIRIAVCRSNKLLKQCIKQSYASTYQYHDNRHFTTCSGNHILASQGVLNNRLLTVDTYTHDHHHHRNFSVESYRYYLSPDFPLVHAAQRVLEMVDDVTGLPWWGSILLTTFALRTFVTLPLSIISMQNMVKLMSLRPILKEKSMRLKVEVDYAKKLYKWDEKKAAQQFRTNMARIVREHRLELNCHPGKSLLVFWFQLPIWLGLSIALRNMSGLVTYKSAAGLAAIHPEMAHQGVLWFTNFMIPDPIFMLPIVCALVNLMNCEVTNLSTPDIARTRFRKIVGNVYRVISLLVLPAGLVLPSSMLYYWTCSSFLALVQTLVLKSPAVKQTVGIPLLPGETLTPFKDMMEIGKQRYGKPFRRKDHSNK